MKSHLLALALATTFAAAPAAGATRIIATTSDLAQLANVLGGDLVEVETLVPPASDPEAFEPRPRDLDKLQRAEIVIRVSLGYDYWLDKLLVQAGNPRLQRGGIGYVDGSVGIPLLDVRSASVPNDAGHAHGAANPHYWLDPQNAVTITGGIAEALIASLPHERAPLIAARSRFLDELRQRLADWTARAAVFAGARFIAYHNSWPYFARRFRFNIVDVIELKPSIPPSPARLAKLISDGRQNPVRAVLHEPYEPEESSRLVGERLGIPVVTLATSVGSIPGTDSYFALFAYNLSSIGTAIAKTR